MIDRPTFKMSSKAAGSPAAKTDLPCAPAAAAAVRLHVEQDGERYVYRVTDAASGEVLREASRDQAHTLNALAVEPAT